jgi:osmotically inducible protein OsmC
MADNQEIIHMAQTARAHWEGDLKTGTGTIALGSGAFEGAYSFKTRFEGAPGTTPEELLGAAHAGCFTMALSLGLTNAGHPATRLDTNASVTLGKVGESFAITRIDLTLTGVVPGLSAEEFQRLAEDAKKNCIISRAIANVPMNLTATLQNS